MSPPSCTDGARTGAEPARRLPRRAPLRSSRLRLSSAIKPRPRGVRWSGVAEDDRGARGYTVTGLSESPSVLRCVTSRREDGTSGCWLRSGRARIARLRWRVDGSACATDTPCLGDGPVRPRGSLSCRGRDVGRRPSARAVAPSAERLARGGEVKQLPVAAGGARYRRRHLRQSASRDSIPTRLPAVRRPHVAPARGTERRKPIDAEAIRRHNPVVSAPPRSLQHL